mgnify:CR=1 FL=1
MKKERKYIIIGIVLLVLILVIGYSFVHFNQKEEQKNPNSDIKDNKANLIEQEYPNGKDIKISNSKPGDSDINEFNVKVTPGKSVKYRISLIVKENTLKKCEETNCQKEAEELVITLIDNDNQVYVKDITNVKKEEEIFLLTEEKNVKEKTTYKYKIKVEFKNLGSNQTHNINKNFEAELKIDY